MPVRDKVYEKMKSFGLTDSKEDFYKYYDNDENVRKDVFKRLQEDGLTDTEEEFYSYMQPSVSKSEESDPFEANVERAKNGEPIQRVSTQSMIDANPELGLKNIPNLPTLKEQVEKSNVRDGKLVFGKPGFNGNEVSALYPMSSETLSNRLSDPRIFDKDMSIRSVNEADEEEKIDAFFHSKPMKTAKDVYDNYSARFSNTERGIELGEELSDISRTITDKYANEYFNSDSYKELAKLYQGEELAKKANEEFQKTYGYTIDKELKPYQDAYNNELSIRYGSNMDEALISIAKESVSGKLNSLTGEVESMLKDSEEKLQQHRSTSGKGLNAIMGNQQYLNDTKSQRKERNMLESAQELLDDSQNIVNEASKKGNTTFIEGLARGFWDNLNAEDFTFGLAELADMKYLNEALKKAEQGEQLTPAEEKLLEASTINMATQAYFSSDLGRGYKAGSVTAESIPFMLEFIANPISGSGNAIAKGLLKFGLKRFGKSMTSKTAKAVGRLIGDATAAVGMTSTTGMPSVLAETYNRLNRNYKYGVGEDGGLYVNKEGDTSFGEAFGKSFTTRAIENQSEMIFHAFKGAGNLLKGVDATLPGGVNTFFDYIKNSKVGELWRGIKNSPLRKELAEATKVGGIGEEYLEEVYNNFANVALGEMSMEEALNLDNNIDTFLGLAPTQVMFSMLGLGNMAALRYKTRRDIEDLRATMNESQRQALDGLLAMGTTATNQDVREFIRNTMANQSLSIDEKRNAVKAAYDVARQKAMADVQEAEVEDKIAEENADIDAKTDPQTGNYGEVTLLGVDESGEPTANPANVFGAKVVDGELYLLVLPEGETEKKWVRPHEYDAESHQIMPGAEVKAYNEQMIRDNAAKQAEQEAKYAPDVLNAQMEKGVEFYTPNSKIVPDAPMLEGNGWIVNEYPLDTNNKVAKTPIVRELTNDEYRDILQAQYEANEATQQQPVQEIAPTTEEDVTNTPVETEEVTQVEEVQPEVVAEEESKEPTLEEFVATLPKTKNNEIDYSALTPQQQYQYTSMTESPEVALEDLQADIAAGQAEIAKTQEQLAKATGGKRAELRDKARKLAATNAELQSFYDSVAPKQEATVAEEKPTETTLDESAANLKPQAPKADSEAKPKPKRKNIVSKKKVDSDFTYEELKPVNGVELAAEQLAAGNIKITIESYKKETGHGEKERKKMGLTPFRSLDKGGMSIERAAEKLVEEDEANHNGHIFNGDTMSARDAIIELLSMSEKWSDVTDYIKNIRLDERKKREEAEYEEYAEYLMLNLDVTPEEYESLNEAEEQRIIALREVIEELDIIFAEAELERQQSIKEYEQGTNVTGDQGQSELLSETRIGNTGGNQGNESQRGTIESGSEVERNSETSQTKESAEVAPSIEQTNVSRMADIEARILEIEGRRNEISDELEAVEDTDVMSIAELRAEEYELNQEQAELEAEYIGLRSMNDESNAISESEGSGLYFRTTTKNEEARRKPLRQRAKEWEQKLGVKVNIIENFDNVTNKDAKKAIRNGQRVTGWYEESTGEVCLYMPYLESAQEIDATYIHEVVAHKGLRGLLGDKFDEFLDDVWNAMSEADKLIYLTYPGVNGNKRAAADEYIAHLAENIDVTESAWGKLAELIKKFLKAIGLEPKMTHADIANTIKLSYQRLLSGEGGVDVVGDGTRFSAKKGSVTVSAEEYAKIAHQIATYPQKADRGHVFTDNNYYLCTDIDDEGNFRIVASLKIEGNEELINSLRGKDGQRNFKAIEGTESLASIVEEVKRRGGRTNWNIPTSKRQSRTNGQNDSVHLGKQSKSGTDQQSSDSDDRKPKFRVVTDKNGKKTLVGLHNISENKLRKALKQGGLANPSVAVIDMDKQSHVDYGDITLVLPASMIDKKTGKNVGTYLADAYTPVYPTVVKKMSDKGAKALTKALESVDETFRSKVRTYFNSYLDSGTIYDALAYWYLSDTGKNPPILEAALPDGFTREEVEKVKSVNPEADSFYQLSEEEKQKALNLYADKFFGGMKEYKDHLADYSKRMQEVVKDESKPQMVRKNIQENLNAIEQYGYEYDRVANYFKRAIFIADRQSKPSEIETFRNASEEVTKNGLEEDFGNWLIAKEEELGVEEKLFAGYDNQGRAKYLPNTLENASKLMKKEGRAGATGLGGFNYFVAILAPVAKTTKQISAKKGNLSTQEEYDKFVEEWKDYYHNLARQLQPGAGKWDDYGYHRLHEIAPMENPKAYVKKEYGIDLSDEFLKDLNDVKNAIKNDFPARYFETKFERPVYLNEVAAAVVPSDMSLDLYGQLQRMGIPMYEYEKGNNEARMAAVDKVTIDNEGIRFRTLPSMKLRKLEEGEKCNVERVFTQQKMFNFSSGEKIESYEDVAYIFKSLEDEAIENTFVALIKNGKPTIVHLGMGTANQSTIDQQAVIVAIDRIKPDEVYMVHNHPSGNLKASRQDVVLLDSMKKAYGPIVKDGIIINLRSGRYSVFNEEGSYAESNPSTPSKEISVKTYSFSKRVFDKDFDIQELITVRGAEDANYYAEKHGLVAALTSSQRLGDRDKISLLVIDQSGKIVGNVFLNHTDVTPSNMTAISKDVAYYTSAMSGQFAIIFGRMNIKEAGHLNMVVQRVSAGSVKMFDAISVNKDGEYVSAANEGVMEEAVDYANNDTRFRIAPQEQVQAEVDKFTSKYKSAPVKVLDLTTTDEQVSEWLGVKDATTEDLIGWMEDENVPAVHVRTNNNIIIFADKIKGEKVKETLFHENLHTLLNDGAHKELVDKFYKSAKDDERFGKWKKMSDKEQYDDYERPEEFFVYVVSNGQVSDNLEDVFEYLTSKEQNELKELLNINGYDYDNRRFNEDFREENKRGSERENIESDLRGRRVESQEKAQGRRNGSSVRTETNGESEKEATMRNGSVEPNQREERKEERGRSKEQAERLKKLFDDVADMGLRGVLGNTNYDLAMLDIFYALPEKERTDVAVRAVKIGGDVAVAVDEYLKDVEEPTLLEKVIASITNALRKVGLDVQLTENDVKYLLWRSRKPLDRNSIFDMAEDIDMRRKLKVGEFDNDPTDGGDTPGGGTRFRTSSEIDKQYPNWLDGTTTESGKHSTQVEGTRKTYNKIGTWIEENLGKDISILDASSGMGYGTSDLRERGFNIEDVEPYQSDERKANNPATYSSYNDINKQYDFIISNAVLNVIPDDWRQIVLHDMASRLKDGGRMFINTRKAGEEKAIKDKIELDSPQEVLVKRNGKIASYQKFYTPSELKEWVEKELGNSYKVEIANRNNSGTNGLAAVVVTKVDDASNSGTRFRVAKEQIDIADERTEIIKKYDKELESKMFNFQEAFQDRMLSLKVLMDLIENETGKKAKSFEDAYTAENQLGSINRPAQLKWLDEFYKPLLEELNKLSKKYGQKEIERYIYCKSGLERNEVLRQRDADETFEAAKAELDEKLAKNEIDQAQYQILLQQADDERKKTLATDTDYSGIRGLLMNTRADDLYDQYVRGVITEAKYKQEIADLKKNEEKVIKDWKQFAENQVANIEKAAEKAELDALWDKINAATNETLRIDFESGMIDRDTYNAEKKMMKYYVPLRNWENTTAEEMYEYRHDMTQAVSSNQKRAKGRKSQADNPIATIALMAQNAIVRGNRNKMKQKLYSFVANRETSLASVRNVWYVRNANNQWEPQYADTSNAKTEAEIKQIMEQFELDMQKLEAQGDAFKGKMKQGMGYRANRKQKDEHVVTVMINGKEYGIYINGNPRAAQAVNGLTNAEGIDDAGKWIDNLKRYYGAGLTSWNPDFIIPNLVRDSIHAATMTFLDKGTLAAAKYIWNTPKVFSQVFKEVSGVGVNDPKLHQYFEEFVTNGGETGYTAIHTLEDYKKEYDKLMNEAKGIKSSMKNGLKEGISKLSSILEAANRIAEDVNRFNAYVTSREEGYDIVKSIDAAKNITVNFNRKGALASNTTTFGKVASLMSRWILFFNPGVQGIYQLVTKSKLNPKRAKAIGATILASGFFMPMINELLVAAAGGDDEDDYWNQTDFKRRNNWMLFTGDGYVTIPLPPVLRELYGIGDIMYGIMTGHINPSKAIYDTLKQIQSAVGFVNLLPEVSHEPDMVTYVKGFAPDVAAPILDIVTNTNFMGSPIAKWTDYNEFDPEYMRVYKGVSPVWKELSMLLNEVGGEEGLRSNVWGNFINPAMMEHLITSYTGGIGKTINNVVGMALDEKENIDLFRKTPIVPRFYTPNDEKTVQPAINRKYYDFNYEYNRYSKALKKYEKAIESGEHPEWQKYIDEMEKERIIEFINYFKAESKVLKKLTDKLKVDSQNKELESDVYDKKAEIATNSFRILRGN